MDIHLLKQKIDGLDPEVHRALRDALIAEYSRLAQISGHDDEDARRTVKALMESGFKCLLRGISLCYGKISAIGKREFLQETPSILDALDQTFSGPDYSKFQSLVTQAKAVLLEFEKKQEAEETSKERWIYKTWSNLLTSEVWFVRGDEEVAKLRALEVPRGLIYTQRELAMVLNLSPPLSETLKGIHAAKVIFNGAVVESNEANNNIKEKKDMGRLADFAGKNSKWLNMEDGQKLTVKFLGYEMEKNKSGQDMPSYRLETSPGVVKTLQSQSNALALFFDEDKGKAKAGAVVSLTRKGKGPETRYEAELIKQGSEEENLFDV